MGRESYASSSLVYGITVKTPYSPCWPRFLKLLQRIDKDKSLAATAAHAIPATNLKSTDDDDDQQDSSSELPEPIAKHARATKSILVSCREAEKEEGDDDKDEDWADDEIAAINYLSEKEYEIPKAAKAAFDVVLGFDHGLTMKTYYGHDEDCSNVALLLQMEEKGVDSSEVSSFEGVSVKKIDEPTFTLKEKEKTDALIKKALDVFGLEVEDDDEPAWTMVTMCRFYR